HSYLQRRWTDTEEPPPGACLNVTPAIGQNEQTKRLVLQLLPRPCPDCGQARHRGVDCPTLARQ
ncbi:hypothetical protein STEG23_029305, partial [Scotinomys teguina]